MPVQILIRIDEEQKRKLQQLARAEQKSLNQKIREIISQYIQEHDIERALRSVWLEIGEELKNAGYNLLDVDRVIKEVRSGK